VYSIANDGPVLTLYSTKDALRGKLVTYDLSKPDQGMHTLVEEDKDGGVLKSVHVADNDKLILVYTRDVKDEMWLYDLKSGERRARIGAELVGTISSLVGRREDDDFFFQISGFVNPGEVYRCVRRLADELTSQLPVLATRWPAAEPLPLDQGQGVRALRPGAAALPSARILPEC